MKNASKKLPSVATGIAARVLPGLLFAPDKDYKSRKKTSKGSAILNKIKGDIEKKKRLNKRRNWKEKIQKMIAKIKEISTVEYSKDL